MFHDEVRHLLDRLVKAYRAGDAPGCAACYTKNGAIYSPYAPPTVGHSAILALHEDWVGESGNKKTLVLLDAGFDGDFGWCLARYSEGDATGDGTSLNVLQRVADGSWLIRLSSLNADDPPLS